MFYFVFQEFFASVACNPFPFFRCTDFYSEKYGGYAQPNPAPELSPIYKSTAVTIDEHRIPHIPEIRDYWAWSIVNSCFCCVWFGILAMIYSNETQKFKQVRRYEMARSRSRITLGFNVISTLLGTAVMITIIIFSVGWLRSGDKMC